MNNVTAHTTSNLNVSINERITLEQRQAIEAYDNKMAFLNSIHGEIATKTSQASE